MPRVPKEGVPERFAETLPPQGEGLSYVEVIMAMQATLGQLTEAVNFLKEQSKEHSQELKDIGKDIHGAKVVIGVMGAFIGLLGVAAAIWKALH